MALPEINICERGLDVRRNVEMKSRENPKHYFDARFNKKNLTIVFVIEM